MSAITVFIIDDEQSHAAVVAESLQRIGAVCTQAFSQDDALRIIRAQSFDVIITDLRMERPESGLEILKAVKQSSEETEVIMMTGHGSVAFAVEAMRQGAFNYLQKPLDLKQLRTIVQKAAESSKLRQDNRNLKERLDEKFGFGGVIGDSPEMRSILERLKRIAPTDATVLIQGDTGTGKELVAQSIHQNSLRKNKPFVALNCAALSESILESELFGHIKGAFTDAASDRLGKFEFANGGTLFLDEVGDMPMATQIKLLRVLENGEITRVGSNNTIKINVRILSATNRSLAAAIEAGTFREDLFHRLKVVTVRLPSLRERKVDIPILLAHFVKLFAKKHHKTIRGVTQLARHAMLEYDWPGNVRQLRNVVESMVVLNFDERIDYDDLPDELTEKMPLAELEKKNLRLTVESDFIVDSTGAAAVVSSHSHHSSHHPQRTERPQPTVHSQSTDHSQMTDESSFSSVTSFPPVTPVQTQPADVVSSFGELPLVGKSLEEIEKMYIQATLQFTGGNREEAARILGIGERTLYRKIKV